MDRDVCDLLLSLLNNSPLEIRGADIAKLAELHARAVEQVSDAAGHVPAESAD